MLKRYGYYGLLRLLFNIIFSKLLVSRKVRIIRAPFYIRGSKFISWGTGFTSGVGLRIDADPQQVEVDFVLKIGNKVQVNDYVHIGAVNKIIIGNNVLIASKVFISDHNHGYYHGLSQSSPDMAPEIRPIQSLPVFIEDNVWLGEQVSVLPGVTIGKGSIIGANSVVSKSIPAYSIAVGVPARIIKQFDFVSNKWEKI